MQSNKVLIVEDDKTINCMIGKAMIREGFEVDQAYDGEMALDVWERDLNI